MSKYETIPAELRALPQWVCAGASRIPINPQNGQPASVVDPKTWGTFERAVTCGYQHIGFVLTEGDPYAIIDLDNKVSAPATPEQLARHQVILKQFESYTEKSASGRGYHIIVRGRVPDGVHRDHVEVYSSSRYMICTGDVVRDAPIADYQAVLDQMYGEMKPIETVDLVEHNETLDDQDLVDMAEGALNGEKYLMLCQGRWHELGYPSQSEADFALLAILCYYTQSNEQVRRLFRWSALGQRQKAQKNDRYLDYALGKIRAQQPGPIEFIWPKEPPKPPNEEHKPPDLPPPAPPPIYRVPKSELPPGLVGELAEYFYATAVRPVGDIALAASLALVAGVSGRSYNVSGTGLNLYIILVARTGSGKEGATSGIDKMIAAVRPQVPMADHFIGPSAFASGQALIKALDIHPCFVSVLGEFGLTLQQLCDPQANGAQLTYRKVLLDLYSKSGWTQVLRPSVYSDTEKNTKLVPAPNVTLLGETTPENFFEGLGASHIAEGLIPRFSVIQYSGHRVPRNAHAGVPPPPALVSRFADLVTIALTTQNNNTCREVSLDQNAQAVLDEWDILCDREINNSDNTDAICQLWNRAHLKALKTAAIAAVGISPHVPVITLDLARWAIEFVRRDVESMADRFRGGDVGHGDSKLGSELKRVIEHYFGCPHAKVEMYGVSAGMHRDRVVPYCYLMRKTACLAAFRRDRRGSSLALKSAIQDLIDSNMLEEMPAMQVAARYQVRGKIWALGKSWRPD